MLYVCQPYYWQFPLRERRAKIWHIRALRAPFYPDITTITKKPLKQIMYDYNVPFRALYQPWIALYHLNAEQTYLYDHETNQWYETEPPKNWIYTSLRPTYQIATVLWYLLASGLITITKDENHPFRWHTRTPYDIVGMFYHEGGLTEHFTNYLAARAQLPQHFGYGIILYQLKNQTTITLPYAAVHWHLPNEAMP